MLIAVNSGVPFSSSGSIEVVYSTIVNNSPLGLVGNVEIKNSILSDNIDGNCREFSPIESNGYNHSDDDSCVFALPGDVNNSPIKLEPLFQLDQYVYSYPLSYQSIAIDTADPADCVDVDQRGVTRPLDGNNDGDSRCDKGAHEMISDIIFSNGFN